MNIDLATQHTAFASYIENEWKEKMVSYAFIRQNRAFTCGKKRNIKIQYASTTK